MGTEVSRSPGKRLSDEVRRPGTVIQVTDGTLIPQKGEKTALTAWNITFFGALAALVILPIAMPFPFADNLFYISDGLFATFQVTIGSIFLATIIGLLLGLARISRVKALSLIATVYVEFIRGIPLLSQLFFIYYGIFTKMAPLPAAILGMSLCYGAYMAEIFRAGILAVPKGQMEAAIALGLTRGQALRKVILPQTFKIILPPMGNEFIALLKDSSLATTVQVVDIVKRTREFSANNLTHPASYALVALVFLVLTLFFSRLVALMEERLNRRGRRD